MPSVLGKLLCKGRPAARHPERRTTGPFLAVVPPRVGTAPATPMGALAPQRGDQATPHQPLRLQAQGSDGAAHLPRQKRRDRLSERHFPPPVAGNFKPQAC